MKKIKFISLLLLLGSSLSLSSCQKESNITKVCTLKTVDALNLYLSSIAKSKISNSYVYLNDKNTMNEYAQEVYDKANNQRPNCDIAYFPVDGGSLKYLFELDKDTKYFKIVYIDCYDNTDSKLSISGVWVARSGWIENKNNTGRKFIDGFAKTSDYRMATMYDNEGSATDAINSDYKMAHSSFKDISKFETFESMFTFMEEKYNQNKLPDYVFNDKNDKIVNYKSIYEYCALFALQNRGLGQPFNNKEVLDNFKKNSKRDNGGSPFINNDRAKELYGSLKEIGKTSEGDQEISEEGKTLLKEMEDKIGITESDDRIELKLMRHGIAHVNDQSSSGDMTKVYMWIGIGSGLLLIVVVLLIIRRIKTGKKLFDVRRALDADIDPDDPKIIRMKKVGKDLKELRENKKLTLEEASKAMHIPAKFMKEMIEEGEMVVSKHNQKKYIKFYNLPEDYFTKAYKIED